MKYGESKGPQLDNDVCVANCGGNRYDMVLIAAARAREIAKMRRDRKEKHFVPSNVAALLEIQQGIIGREYLRKVK